ncbi:MAG: FHA domain-containing protein [Acetobacter sp.]|nr:FHA domain-containing protein [Bacteroides sp.]MCM1341283.1 FHA domain-containing protein [Acetobacter sp.]MCM1433941.1 FHA domain-containing protein [Clostridiales bacterium]
MDIINSIAMSVSRYAVLVVAVIIVFTCVISLFKNRPRLHKMAQLVDQSDGSIIDIDRWEISIGKSKSNDIVLMMPGVSRFHAVISKRRKEWTITDTFSKTGIIINGEKIDGKAVIEDGDVIEIGSVSLKFVCADAISQQVRSEIRTAATEFKQPSKNVAYAVLVDVKTHKPIYLRKKDVLIGRGENADIRIALDTVSSEHARIHLTSRGWALSDLNSHNGTKLNGRFISQPQLIFDEDTITFGERVFIFYER